MRHRVALDARLLPALEWFSESASRVVLSVGVDRVDDVLARAAGRGRAGRGHRGGRRRPATAPPSFAVELTAATDALARRHTPCAGERTGPRLMLHRSPRSGTQPVRSFLPTVGSRPALSVHGILRGRWNRRSVTPAACSASTRPGSRWRNLTYQGLYALQHRGQESAGIAVSDGQTITVVKDMGLVTQVFDERRLAPLDGHLAIGHVRYSTTGSSTLAQRPARLPRGRRRRVRARAQRQPHEHRRARGADSGCCPGCCPTDAGSTPPPTPRSSPSSSLPSTQPSRAPTVATSSTRSSACSRGSRAGSRS